MFQGATSYAFLHFPSRRPLRSHDASSKAYSNASTLRCFRLHGNGSVVRNAILRPSAHRFHASEIPTRLQLLAQSAVEESPHVHRCAAILLCWPVGSQNE